MTASLYEPELSVVIACYDQTEVLETTLNSFLTQQLPCERYEMLVIDDHSPDHGARTVVGALRRAFPDARLHYLRHHRPDGGTYGASAVVKNIGIRMAVGRYVFLNNAEICQAGESLTRILHRMRESDTLLCLRGRVLDLPLSHLEGKGPAALEKLHDITDRARERVASADHAGLAAVPRRMLLSVGGIDERFDYWGKEDLDLAARLKRAGVRYIYDEALKSFHIHHPPNHVKQGDYLRMCALLEENNANHRIDANAGVAWGNLCSPTPEALSLSVLVEGGEDLHCLHGRLEKLYYGAGAEAVEVVVVCHERHRPGVSGFLLERFRGVPLLVLPDAAESGTAERLINRLKASRVGFLPAGARPVTARSIPTVPVEGIIPWLEDLPFPAGSARQHQHCQPAWVMPVREARRVMGHGETLACWGLSGISNGCRDGFGTALRAAGLSRDGDYRVLESASNKTHPPLSRTSRILAVIPFYDCEPWLELCLDALDRQTRKPDGVVVIADGDAGTIADLVRNFRDVTLLASGGERVGPYRLIQSLMAATDYDGYLFQDADDWSAADRLELLLKSAERYGAELVGSQELRYFEDEGRFMPVTYPLDVNAALEAAPGHPLLHPTSLVARSLVMRVGGYSSGLRFGADTEFLLRAAHAGRIVNIQEFAYFRRHRKGALTTSPETGLDSPVRLQMTETFKTRARENARAVRQGRSPDLRPMHPGTPIRLYHVCGPPLEMVDAPMAMRN